MSGPAVPFVDLTRQHESLRPELEEAFRSVLDSGQFVLGPVVERFEQEWADYCEAAHAVGVASGTAALALTMEALGVGPGDEVIAPANTFVASVLPALHRGARVVLVDCDPATATIDVDAAAAAITERTKLLVAVHLYGQPADLDPLLELAREHGFDVVEDACQAHGARYQGRRVGALGRAGCFSFYPSKNLGALGDGGAIVTDDPDLARELRILRDLGQARKYVHVTAGHNERLDPLQAAVLSVKLPRLDGWSDARRARARDYAELLAGLEVDLPSVAADGEHVWHLYVVRAEGRDRLRDALAAESIGTGLHYPEPLHRLELAPAYGLAEQGPFPAAEDWSRRGLSLPMFPELERSEAGLVARALAGTLAAA